MVGERNLISFIYSLSANGSGLPAAAMVQMASAVDAQSLYQTPPCPPIDSILKVVTVWRKTGKIIRTALIVNYICTCI